MGAKSTPWICLQTSIVRAAPIFSLMINAVYTRIRDTSHPKVSKPIPVPHYDTTNECCTGKSMFATLTCDYAIGRRLCWQTQTKISLKYIPDNVLQYIIHQFGLHFKLCTEIKYKTSTYRCHPSYQSGFQSITG